MTYKPHIVAADDQADNRLILEDVLSRNYNVRLMSNGKEVLDYIEQNVDVDLFLLDIVMPEMDGFEVCKRLKNHSKTENIPVIFLTGLDSHTDEEYGLSLGAADFIHKPFSEPVMLARINNHLRISEMSRNLRERNEILEARISERNRSLIAAQSATITAFCSLAETRDDETGNHILRTQHYVKIIAERLQRNLRYTAELTDENILWMFKCAPLHDIGKVGIPDAILQKPGKLDPNEWAIMKTHCQIGADVISEAEVELGQNSFLTYAREIALSHHERWDGKGYPMNLEGEDIPLSARIMALADVYDALISKRCYKDPFSHEQAIEMILEQSDRQFDPHIVKAFEEVADQFNDVAIRFGAQHHPDFS